MRATAGRSSPLSTALACHRPRSIFAYAGGIASLFLSMSHGRLHCAAWPPCIANGLPLPARTIMEPLVLRHGEWERQRMKGIRTRPPDHFRPLTVLDLIHLHIRPNQNQNQNQTPPPNPKPPFTAHLYLTRSTTQSTQSCSTHCSALHNHTQTTFLNPANHPPTRPPRMRPHRCPTQPQNCTFRTPLFLREVSQPSQPSTPAQPSPVGNGLVWVVG